MAATILTGTPTSLLSEQADIETTVPPGFHHLEKYAIPRFSSVSAANQAFTAIGGADLHELRWITSKGHLGLEIFDGSTWIEFGEFTRTRTFYARNAETQVRSSTLFGNAVGYSFPLVAGTYHIGLDMIYISNSNREIRVNFTFPGATSRMTFGLVGRGMDATGGGTQGSTIYSEAAAGRTSGDVTESEGLGGTSEANALYARGGGVLVLEAAGTFQMQYARRGSTGDVQLTAGTVLSATRIA